jgi:hypothetical protein
VLTIESTTAKQFLHCCEEFFMNLTMLPYVPPNAALEREKPRLLRVPAPR